MTMTTRVEALVRLAASKNTPETEARNAALAACRLIVEHKFAIVANVPPPQSSASPWESERPIPPVDDDIMHSFRTGVNLGRAILDSLDSLGRVAASANEVHRAAKKALPKTAKRKGASRQRP